MSPMVATFQPPPDTFLLEVNGLSVMESLLFRPRFIVPYRTTVYAWTNSNWLETGLHQMEVLQKFSQYQTPQHIDRC
jgi:hypothetical protein